MSPDLKGSSYSQIFSSRSFSAVSTQLSQSKAENAAPLFKSARVFAKNTLVGDLQRVSRSSFSSEDFLSDLMRQTELRQNSYQAPVLIFSAISITFGALLVPILPLSIGVKNLLGLMALFLPLLFIGLNIISPSFRFDFLNNKSSSSQIAGTSVERISYHEAGHFLLGYLLGIPIVKYDISGEKDAGTELSTDAILDRKMTLNYEENLDIIGALLCISMGGVVAESLRFGSSLGGSQDFVFAFSLMRDFKIPSKEREGYLRGGVLNALVLLTEYRDTLDEVAEAMKESRTVEDCFVVIEDSAKKDTDSSSS